MLKIPLLLIASSVFAQTPVDAPKAPAPAANASVATFRGVHFTGWAAGSTKARRRFAAEMKGAGFNAVVIALKDYDGHVFVRDVPLAVKTGAFTNAIPDLPLAVKDFEDLGIYTVARIAIFKDDLLARARPDLAVHFPDGRIWTNDNGTAWVDPYKKEIWDYAIDIASRAAIAGFDEIQFDYIRFPSDGKTRQCRYSRADHSSATAAAALSELLKVAVARLKPLGVKVSVDTFGLTTSVGDGMGIGQSMEQMAELVDYVSPMMYPSHYARGEYGLKHPNAAPYETIQRGVKDALERLGPRPEAMRPYLQDFSMGVRYSPAHVRTQILAAEELGVRGWILWNAQNHYSWSAIQAGPVIKLPPQPPKPPKPPKKPKRDKPAPAPAPVVQAVHQENP
ncbi:MAG: putative glycoside hydrolase [Elusimicrobiota bacterium]|nr:putative glycoside hydrolase [Elusimicrobiota bacterium]